MRTTIDAAGRIVVPKTLRERLGFTAGTELEVEAIDGRLEVSAPSNVRIEETPDGPVLVADENVTTMTVEDVRALIDQVRR